MRKRLWLLVALALLVAALGTTAPRVQGAGEIAPQVVDTVPARGEELPIDSSLTLYFDQAMDRASVQAAFVVTPTVKGDLTWTNDSTAVFKPSALLDRGKQYAFSLKASAISKTGTALRDTFTLKLRTPGTLEVSQILPADKAKNIEATPTITVIFNRPVVALLPAEQMAALPSPITISPAVEGTGTWLNTSIYTFKPKLLSGSTTYTITVKKGLTDITGSPLINDVTTTFSTVAPRVVDVEPRDKATSIARDPEFSVTFSQPMDKIATEGAISILPLGPKGQAVAGAAPIALNFKWSDDTTAVTITPKGLLDYTANYRLFVDDQKARSATGGVIEKAAFANFSTIGLPAITSTQPQNGDNAEPYGGFTISFASPMKLDNFKSRVTIDPKPELLYDDQIADDFTYYAIGFGTEPGTKYTVTIDTKGLADKYGTLLKLNPQSGSYDIIGPDKIQIKYTTSDYRPEASLKTGSYIGLYSAYRPQTKVFSTHRNLSKLELSLFSLPIDDFLKLNSSNGYDFQNNYTPTNFLRRWEVPVQNPANILRYDLLTISDQGPNLGQAGNVTCPGAPVTQIKVGDAVVVLKDDPTPLRLRDKPGLSDSKIVGTAKPGVELTITSGPICADKFEWWQVLSKDGTLSGWTAEGDLTRYFIGPKVPLKPTPTKLVPTPSGTEAADAQAKALKPGVYWLDFSAPELDTYDRTISHLMIVATANITFKTTEHELIAWVTDLQSGKPVANTDITFYTGVLAVQRGTVKTDANGLAHFAIPDGLDSLYHDVFAVVNDGKNFGIGIGSWSDGIEPSDFNLDSNYYPQDITAYLYTDRSLYRPGEPVYFRGVLRSKDDVTYTISSLKTVPVEIFDDQGKSIYQKDVPVTAFGTFADTFNLDANTSLGYYRIVARPGFDPNKKTATQQPEFSQGFNVAEYRLPEFQVQATADKDQVVQGDKISVKVDSSFFFGGAVNNADVTYTVSSQPYFFNYTGPGYYSFTDYNEDAGYQSGNDNSPLGSTVAEGKGKTDDQGKFTIEVPADLGKVQQSQVFTIEANVTDESGQQVSARAAVTVNQGLFYIGVAAEDYVGAAKQPQKVDLLSTGWDSKPAPGQDIAVKVVERVWSSVETIEPGTGKTVWNYDVKENPLVDGVVHTDQDGKAVYEFTPPHGGIYKIYATSRDSNGNQITSSAFAWIAGPDYVPWRQQNSNRIDVKIDHDSYKVGDTASILIASPFQGEATALITVERGHLIKTEVVTMPTNSYVYKLPITPDMAPDAFVSIMIVKGVDDKNPVAAFRMGLIQFGVETERLKLNIKVTPDKDQAGPRETVNYKLHVTNYNGEPVSAEVGVALVDQAALSLLPDQSTPIIEHFYGKQSLAVRTSSSLTLSVDQQTQQIINTVKGGGGGGPETGIFQVREEFVTTPLWSPTITTDVNGDAAVQVKLPDNLTTWRLDARAVSMPMGDTGSTLVGQTTFDLISTKPLLIRPVTPRFYVLGDESVLGAVVNNNTDQPQDVVVRIDAQGVTLKGDATQKGTIPARGRSRFDWPITVNDVNQVGVTFFANTPDNKYTDAAKSAVGQGDDKTLPVLRYEAPETVGTGGILTKTDGDRTEGIVLPRRYNVTQGTLDIKVDPSLAASATDALKVLQNYPYQCLEQTVSRFLPNLMTYRALKQLGIDDPIMKAQLTQTIDYAVQRLYNEQHVDGGWGWWIRDSSDELVTAYAIIGLSEAKKQDFNIDKQVIAQATKFVQKHLSNLPDQAETWQLNRQAFLLYALARSDPSLIGTFAQAVRLFGIREKLSTYARAYLAMTFHLYGGDQTRYTDPLVSDLQNRAIASATGMHWEEDYFDYWNWNTDTRTTSIVLSALVELQPTNQLIPNIVRWLMINRTADAWETTQETAWAVMALTDWMQYTGELKPNYSYGVTLNDKALTTDQKVTAGNVRQSADLQVAVKDLLTDQVNKLAFTRTDGDGTMYYTAHLTAYLPVEQVKALSRGLTITRVYSQVNDKDRKPITQGAAGDTIRVTLNIVAPNDLNYIQISDPLPAGAEAINPDFVTSSQAVGQAPDLSVQDPFYQGWGWWWLSKTELRDDRTVMYATYLPAGTYQFTYTIRLGLAGTYHVIPATGQEFYFPEVYGRSDGSLFTITGTSQ